jgi:hypothetical protein
MDQTLQYDAIIVLGGGRIDEENLTVLSTQRLDCGVELYHKGLARKIFAIGEHRSTFSTSHYEAISFRKTGAELRKEYLIGKGVPSESIIEVPLGADTIVEAFASALFVKDLGFEKVILVTSDKHALRAKEIFQEAFRRVFNGDNFKIEISEVPCGDLHDETIEQQLLMLTKDFFCALPDDVVTTKEDLNGWYERYREFYERLETLIRLPNSEFLQAYAGAKEKK